jgi:predicted dehydrogenase
MHQVAIIGAGQLGRRHLQGLVKSIQPMIVHVVDPSEASIRAVQDFISSANNGTMPEILLHASTTELPAELDLVIIATTSDQRLEVLEQLVGTVKVRHLILEKFLFNDTDHYDRAEALIKRHGVTAWVNTPRRHFEIYRRLREQTHSQRLLQFIVDGGDWGLCCNSVHFVDLAQYLTDATEIRSLRTRFDEGILQSKRKGYIELTGEMAGELGSACFTLRSVRDSTKPITISLYYEKATFIVVESASMYIKLENEKMETETFHIPYQSEMTGVIADQLLDNHTCNLTTFSESVAAHIPLLHVFSQSAGKSYGTRVYCAIT